MSKFACVGNISIFNSSDELCNALVRLRDARTFQLCSIPTCVFVAIKYKCYNRLAVTATASATTASSALLS